MLSQRYLVFAFIYALKEGHRGPVLALQYDATRIISIAEDLQIKIWNIKSGQATTIRSSSQPRCFCNCGIVYPWVNKIGSSEGKKIIAVGCDDGTIKLFATTGGAPKKLLKGHGAK